MDLVRLSSTQFGSVRLSSTQFDCSIQFDPVRLLDCSIQFDSVRFSTAQSDLVRFRCSTAQFDSARFNSIQFDSVRPSWIQLDPVGPSWVQSGPVRLLDPVRLSSIADRFTSIQFTFLSSPSTAHACLLYPQPGAKSPPSPSGERGEQKGVWVKNVVPGMRFPGLVEQVLVIFLTQSNKNLDGRSALARVGMGKARGKKSAATRKRGDEGSGNKKTVTKKRGGEEKRGERRADKKKRDDRKKAERRKKAG